MQIVILASGRGKRTKSKIPKSLIKLKSKSLFEKNITIYNKFSKKIITLGYKFKLFQKFLDSSYDQVINKKFLNTNMVESFFLTKRKIKKNEDILICYADIILDNKIKSKA